MRYMGWMTLLGIAACWVGCGGVSRNDCKYGGETYREGESFTDDCNTCTCEEGTVSCTEKACGTGCYHQGSHYEVGDTFPSGCNMCSCRENGDVACTDIACSSCEAASSTYQAALPEAKACDPLAENQCSHLIMEGLACACPIFANPENAEAISQIEAAQAEYANLSCAGDIACGACPEATSGFCSAEGICETQSSPSGEAACKVGDVVYESGEGGIADPFSCNTCTCQNGGLSCTKIACETPCPPDSVNGTQCAQCGPADECEVVEHTCLKVCSDTCESGTCVDGVCRTVCG